MRYLLASFLLSLLLTAGASLPASAAQRWSEEGIRYVDRADYPRRQRLARATYGEVYDDEEAAPRRRSYHRHDGSRSRYTKRRHTRAARHMQRRQRTARKPGISRKAAHQPHKPAQRSASTPTIVPKERDTGSVKRSGIHGMASYYWEPQALASGGRFNPNALTAAHKTLPFGTRVRVTHLGNGRSVEVKINDRGPYVAGRIIDLSKAAAGVIGMTAQGVARVAVEVLGK